MKFINADINKFTKMLIGKKLICFGAGQELVSFLDTYSQYEWNNFIYRILDNSNQKIGTFFSYRDINIPS